MTCIVGLVHQGKVIIGADSQASKGYVVSTLAPSTPKVFRLGEMVIGVCGSLRTLQLLRFALTLPSHPESRDVMAYIAVDVANAVRECLKSAGNAKKDSDQENHESELLIAYRGRLYSLHSDYSVMEVADGYYAVGSGAELAMGALHMSTHMGDLVAPKQRVRWALEASAAFNHGVSAPFILEVLETVVMSYAQHNGHAPATPAQ